ncbi:FMN-linked oxidoreductase [Imleria badia]|nr:FMN-linked oxidoreductase [Imleria badia]
MVTINSITISPPLINTACAWASDEPQLTALFDCPYTGAVTTRTVTLGGFNEDASHTVAFFKDSLSSINSYGYSPHPLFSYIGPGGWIRSILKRSPDASKPFIISITESHATDLRLMLNAIQGLRAAQQGWASRIAIELNTSCPNIPARSPASYDPTGPALAALLDVLAEFFWKDTSLTIGVKLPPYVAGAQIADVVQTIATYSRVDPFSDTSVNPIAFLTCTNTLGNSLVFADQVEGATGEFAVPPGVGGLAGEAIHALSLGNVYAFSKLLAASEDSALRQIVVIGAGGITSAEAVARMHRAGAKVVGSATLLGKLGVAAFERLSKSVDSVLKDT